MTPAWPACQPMAARPIGTLHLPRRLVTPAHKADDVESQCSYRGGGAPRRLGVALMSPKYSRCPARLTRQEEPMNALRKVPRRLVSLALLLGGVAIAASGCIVAPAGP